MILVKSLSVGKGDMFYIKHGSDNFSIIDCCMDDSNKDRIVDELKRESKNKGITRFISTHPDDDHIRGLDYLDNQMSIVNFYCVKNEGTKTLTNIPFRASSWRKRPRSTKMFNRLIRKCRIWSLSSRLNRFTVSTMVP